MFECSMSERYAMVTLPIKGNALLPFSFKAVMMTTKGQRCERDFDDLGEANSYLKLCRHMRPDLIVSTKILIYQIIYQVSRTRNYQIQYIRTIQ